MRGCDSPCHTADRVFRCAKPHAVGWGRSQSHRYGTARSHTGADAYAHAGSDKHPHAGADAYAHAGSDKHPHAGADAYAHAGSDKHPHAGADAYAHAGSDKHPHAGADAYAHAGSDKHPHAGANAYAHHGSDKHTPTPVPTPAAMPLSLNEYLTHCAPTDLELADNATFGDLSSVLAAEADSLEALTPPAQLSEWHLLAIKSFRTVQAVIDLRPKDDVIGFADFILIAAGDLEEKLDEVSARLPEDVRREVGCRPDSREHRRRERVGAEFGEHWTTMVTSTSSVSKRLGPTR